MPAGAELYAGYDDGNWPDAATIAELYPGKVIVRVTTDAGDNEGQVLDVENGDATPNQAPAWAERRRAAGQLPTVYCNLSTWPGARQAFDNAEVPQPSWWIADWGPAVTVLGAVAIQYAAGPEFDESLVADYWPGVDPAPVPDEPPSPVPTIPTVTEVPQMFEHDPVTGGIWGTDENGDGFGLYGAPYPGGLNTHPAWKAGDAESAGQNLCVGLAYWCEKSPTGNVSADGVVYFTQPASGAGGIKGTPYSAYRFLRDGTPD
jgi:hypothetical protein